MNNGNIEVYSTSGRVKLSSSADQVHMPPSGGIAKINIAKSDISGVVRSGNSLIVHKTNGAELKIDDFFVSSGQKNKLVIEDDGELYLAKYDDENFSGLEFSSISTLEDAVSSADDALPTALWLVPLIAVAAVATGLAVSSHKSNKHEDGTGGTGGSGSSLVGDLINATSELSNMKSESVVDRGKLDEAIHSTKSSLLLEDLNGARNALAKLVDTHAAMMEKKNELDKLILLAKKQGSNVDGAEGLSQNIASELIEIEADIEKGQSVLQSVENTSEAVSLAREALAVAEREKHLAEEAINKAIFQKQKALADNDNHAVNSVNKMIYEANSLLASANEKIEYANKLVESANVQIDSLGGGGGNLSSISETTVKIIESGLTIDKGATLFESVSQFLNKIAGSLKSVFESIVNTNPFELIKDVSAAIIGGVSLSGIVNTVIDFIKLPVKVFCDAYNAVGGVFGVIGAGFESLGNIVSGGFTLISDIKHAIFDGISAVLEEKGIFGVINPFKWFEYGTSIIGTVCENLKVVIGGAVSKLFSSIFENETLGVIKNYLGETLYDTFIKGPFDNILKPILDNLMDIDLISSIASLPGQVIGASEELVTDIVSSITGTENVIEIAIKNDALKDINVYEIKNEGSVLRELLTENSGDIELYYVNIEYSEEVPTLFMPESDVYNSYHVLAFNEDKENTLSVAV
jgi:hypothetical protein